MTRPPCVVPSRVVPTEVPKVGVTGARTVVIVAVDDAADFGVVCMDIYGSCLVSSLVNCPYINRSYWNNKQHKKLSVIYQSISNNSTQLNSSQVVDLTWPNSAYSLQLTAAGRSCLDSAEMVGGGRLSVLLRNKSRVISGNLWNYLWEVLLEICLFALKLIFMAPDFNGSTAFSISISTSCPFTKFLITYVEIEKEI